MSDALPQAIAVYRRPSARDLGAIPLDTVDFLDIKSGLRPLELGVYMNLRTSLWLRGSLPVGLKALSAIAQVTPRTFARMAPALEPLFDHDSDGRWRDYALEAQRGAPALPPGAGDAVDVTVSETRAVAGRRGAAKRWAAASRQTLALVGGQDGPAVPASGTVSPGPDASSYPDVMANDMAKAMANGSNDMAKAMANGSNGMANGMANAPDADGKTGQFAIIGGVQDSTFAIGSASRTPGPSDRLFSEILQEEQQTDGRTSAREGDAGHGTEDGKPDGKPGDFAIAPTMPADGKTAPFAMAGDGTADGKSATARLDHVAMIDALGKAAGSKAPASGLTLAGIAPLLGLLDEGCDFARDMLPAIEHVVPGLREPLRSWKAGFLHDAIRANRDQAAATTRASPAAIATQVFVAEGSPEWRAWLAHLKRRSNPCVEWREHGNRRGWRFPSLWPPGTAPATPKVG